MQNEFEQWKLSHDYAWSWFEYHAGQRMNVFRFFFLFVGILAAGAATLYGRGDLLAAAFISFLIAVFSYLFWRLDIRSADLIKIAERHLSASELYLSTCVGESINLTSLADKKDNHFAKNYTKNYITDFLFSFRKIIATIYTIVGIVGLVTGGLIVTMALCKV